MQDPTIDGEAGIGTRASASATPAAGRRDSEVRRVDGPTRLLRALLVAAIVESFIHYTDNTLRYDDYTATNPSLAGSLVGRWMIPTAWVLFTVAAMIGYRRFRQGHWPRAAAWIGAYSASGLISVFHYVDISPSELSAFQNTFVFLDVLLGEYVLGFAVWAALRTPDLPVDRSEPNPR